MLAKVPKMPSKYVPSMLFSMVACSYSVGSQGVERKMIGCSMFTKVMYLADLDEFVPRAEGERVQRRLKEIFGATDEDYAKLRITALGAEKMDISVLEAMITEKPAEDEGKGGGEGGEPTPA